MYLSDSCKFENTNDMSSFSKAAEYATCSIHTRAIKRPSAIFREILQSLVDPTNPPGWMQDQLSRPNHSIQSEEGLCPSKHPGLDRWKATGASEFLVPNSMVLLSRFFPSRKGTSSTEPVHQPILGVVTGHNSKTVSVII
jgi:hypothetical protein